MNTTQYTIRNIPASVDKYLRKRARLTGRSLNQVVIDELTVNAGVTGKSNLDWFIGSGIDKSIVSILNEDDIYQKNLAKVEHKNAH